MFLFWNIYHAQITSYHNALDNDGEIKNSCNILSLISYYPALRFLEFAHPVQSKLKYCEVIKYKLVEWNNKFAKKTSHYEVPDNDMVYQL